MAKKGALETAATARLTDEKVPFAVHHYRSGKDSDLIPADADSRETALALGVDPDRVFDTRVALVDGEPIIAMVQASAVLDLPALAASVGASEATMSDRHDLKKLTGYGRKSLSALGLKAPLPTMIDTSALDFPTIVISAGQEGYALELSPDDLIRITKARTAPIGRVL